MSSLEHGFTSQRILVDVDDLFGLVQVPHSLRNLATGLSNIDQKQIISIEPLGVGLGGHLSK